ncbi:hypothetical protein NL108_010379 [Boleophthalmus pectinirostris]|nr:hypothetical protein NL108_010379 [Boleophthalmus pectinirostris]
MILDVLIIGSGPHALTLSTLLSSPGSSPHTGHGAPQSPPTLETSRLSKTKSRGRRKIRTATASVVDPPCPEAPGPPDTSTCPKMRLSVVDSYGRWAGLWEGQFVALNIPHLRSHTLVHTDPFHKVERYNLDSLLLKGTVESIVPVMEQERPVGGSTDSTAHRRVKYFRVGLQDCSELRARRVVMATGPTRAQMANVPSWVSAIGESYPEGALQHTVKLMHHLPLSQTSQTQGQCVVCTEGQRVMVVGGGLTSAHVVSIALQQGASHVTWVMRKYLQLKQFDVGDVESLVGRYSHVEHGIQMDGRAFLCQFYSEKSLHRRLAMIRQARKGGAVTPEAYTHLQPFIQEGRVNEARWCYRTQAWSLSLTTGGQWSGDVIWLATGCKLDAKQDPLLSEVIKEFPIQVLDGWPCISESLQWAEGCPLYLMGQYTALQIGPHAVNLAGGQAASYRIAKHIWHQLQQNQDDPHNTEKNDRSKTEEYVQQMHGLLWL